MLAIKIKYNEADQLIEPIENEPQEPWDAVCESYDNDVQRIRDVNDQETYTAVYACYDENNQPIYYLVEEGEALMRMRRRTFLSKLGR